MYMDNKPKKTQQKCNCSATEMQQKCDYFATASPRAHVSWYLQEMEHLQLQTVGDHSPLTEWLVTLFDRQQVELVMAQYGIGSDDGLCTLLPYVDRHGVTRDIRRVLYDEACGTALPAELESRWHHQAMGRHTALLPSCLFGEEMVTCMPQAVVGLAHDEVEVLLARLWRPDMAWVCLPHGEGLHLDTLTPLAERNVLLWPMAGRLEAARQMAATLAAQLHMHISIPTAWQRILSGSSPPPSLATLIARGKPLPSPPQRGGREAPPRGLPEAPPQPSPKGRERSPSPTLPKGEGVGR